MKSCERVSIFSGGGEEEEEEEAERKDRAEGDEARKRGSNREVRMERGDDSNGDRRVVGR